MAPPPTAPSQLLKVLLVLARDSKNTEKLKNDIGEHLNRSQMGALTHALTRRLTLVQGPPGTGKTHSAIEILTQMVRNRLCPFPILATSDSNIAVDNLLEGLTNQGVIYCTRLQ